MKRSLTLAKRVSIIHYLITCSALLICAQDNPGLAGIEGHSYQLQAMGTDKCFTVSVPTSEYSPVHLWTCHEGQSQKFFIDRTTDGSYLIGMPGTELYWHVNTSRIDALVNITMRPLPDDAGSHFSLENAGDGFYYLRAGDGTGYVQATNISEYHGMIVLSSEKTDAPEFKFKLLRDNSPPVSVGPAYLISEKESQHCLSVVGKSNENDEQFYMGTCSGAPSHRFTFEDAGSGQFYIRSESTGKYLLAVGPGATTNVVLAEKGDDPGLIFTFKGVGYGSYHIVAVHSGFLLKAHQSAGAEDWQMSQTDNESEATPFNFDVYESPVNDQRLYSISTGTSENCLSQNMDNGHDHKAIEHQPCADRNNSKFLLEKAGNGCFFIRVLGSDTYLNISDAEGATLQTGEYQDQDNFKFFLDKGEDNIHRIGIRQTGKYLYVQDEVEGSDASVYQGIPGRHDGQFNFTFSETLPVLEGQNYRIQTGEECFYITGDPDAPRGSDRLRRSGCSLLTLNEERNSSFMFVPAANGNDHIKVVGSGLYLKVSSLGEIHQSELTDDTRFEFRRIYVGDGKYHLQWPAGNLYLYSHWPQYLLMRKYDAMFAESFQFELSGTPITIDNYRDRPKVQNLTTEYFTVPAIHALLPSDDTIMKEAKTSADYDKEKVEIQLNKADGVNAWKALKVLNAYGNVAATLEGDETDPTDFTLAQLGDQVIIELWSEQTFGIRFHVGNWTAHTADLGGLTLTFTWMDE